MKALLYAFFLKSISATFYHQHVTSYSEKDVIFEEDVDSKLSCLQKSIYFDADAVYEGGRCRLVKKGRDDLTGQVISSSDNYCSMINELPNDDCIEKEWSETDLFGYDIASFDHINKRDCVHNCKQNAFCRFWTWGVYLNNAYSTCWIKTTDFGKKIGTAYTSGMVCGVKDCEEAVHEDTNYVGNNIKFFAVDNADDCKNKCRREIGCNFWTLRKSDKMCHTKFTSGIPTKSSNFVSGTVCKK